MCSKGWQDTGGCNGNCDSVSKCASHVNWGTPGFLVDRGNYGGMFCAQCQSVEEIAGGNNNYDLYEYVDCPSGTSLNYSWSLTICSIVTSEGSPFMFVGVTCSCRLLQDTSICLTDVLGEGWRNRGPIKVTIR